MPSRVKRNTQSVYILLSGCGGKDVSDVLCVVTLSVRYLYFLADYHHILLLRPQRGLDRLDSFPGTPATSYYNDPQSPPSAR